MDTRERIRRRLIEVYGEAQGSAHYNYVLHAIEDYRKRRLPDAGNSRAESQADGEQLPVETLAGKVFAICYPDNVYNDADPTLQTLHQVLEHHFPSINGVHILPERLMSHGDLWPQDLHFLLPSQLASDFVSYLQKRGFLTGNRTIAGTGKDTALLGEVSSWYDTQSSRIDVEKEIFLESIQQIVESRRNSHFNDGGFSQISRARVDPRFGNVADLRSLSNRYALMLDYVVNHLDIDNETLEAFRRGENDGGAFIIISPEEYERRKKNGDISKTFRPRPFPLFTGLRKYPMATAEEDFNAIFEDAGLTPIDRRIIDFFAIYFKLNNGQGLTDEDRRTTADCIGFLSAEGVDTGKIFTESEVHEGQPAFTRAAGDGMYRFCELAGMSGKYAKVFEVHDDRIYGEKFFVYTTFSESQADINPVSEAGFKLIIDDLFHLLTSGELLMMRMDAVKYLWKEIGKRNFDMEEGNKLIEVIRLLLSLVAPDLVPLDEVNSPDQEVYRMGRDGGFAYLFGQVNAVPAAFNTGSLKPLERLTQTMAAECPEDLLLFVMLSTHDGRSIQGIGVDRPDGHVSICEYYQQKRIAEARGAKVKYRTVPPGVVPAGTFEKACRELNIKPVDLEDVFLPGDGEYRLKKQEIGREEFRLRIQQTANGCTDEESLAAVSQFLTEWLIGGRAPYELCCTTRSAFNPADLDGKPLTPTEEARRLAAAQVFVLSFGQAVPAIYFNDLLGLENDTAGYEQSGQPRDLNRHKSHIESMERALIGDEFTKRYVSILNRAIRARSEDPAFQPMKGGYEFHSLNDTVFLNHASANGHHSLVLGNIGNTSTPVRIEFAKLDGMKDTDEMIDRLSGKSYRAADGAIELEMEGYGELWLSVL